MKGRDQSETTSYGLSRKRTARARESGSTMVESAFVVVVLLTMMFGIVDFGRALYTYHFVADQARQATRWASVRGKGTSLPGGTADGDDVQAFVQSVSGMGLDPTKITATTSWVAPPSGVPSCTQPNDKVPGCVVQVEVDYAFSFFLPFFPSGLKMSSTSQMVISD
jgi:Flp pilus assembly protein TadG